MQSRDDYMLLGSDGVAVWVPGGSPRVVMSICRDGSEGHNYEIPTYEKYII